MRYATVCSGIEAPSVAWEPLGWEPQFFSEIEPFPCSALAHHYPSTPNLGNMNGYKSWPGTNIDVLIGGTPCQAFSVAGLRKGLDDARGGLTLTYLKIVERYQPRWMVWENVPGILSIDGGRAFGSFLGGLAELGYGFAYRILDAQYVRVDGFGRAVPQRRRRVFVVGCAGADWKRAAAVLFERQSLCGHSPPRRKAGSRYGAQVSDVAPGVTASGQPFSRPGNETDTPEAMGHLRGVGFDASEDGTGRGTPMIPEVSLPLKVGNGSCSHRADAQTFVPEVAWCLQERDAKGPDSDTKQGHLLPVALTTSESSGVRDGLRVRRLLPVECERLQGFHDGYTDVPHRGKPACDGPRYKALGNSMAVNVIRWIGRRIQMVDDIKSDRREACR